MLSSVAEQAITIGTSTDDTAEVNKLFLLANIDSEVSGGSTNGCKDS